MVTIHFYLRFHSTVGQSFFITGNIAALGENDTERALFLKYLNEEYWHGSIEVAKDSGTINYQYILEGPDGFKNLESAKDRFIDLQQIKTSDIQVMDTWNYAGEFENAFFTQPFTETLLKHPAGINGKPVKAKSFTHIFKIKAPLLAPNETLCMLGTCEQMGEWEKEKALLMGLEGNWYTAYLDLSKNLFPIGYKYGVWDTAESAFVRFETGDNRTLYNTGGHHHTTILHDGFAGLPNDAFRGAGVAIPVFSLRTKNSFGVGEFNDIKKLVDWSKKVGLKLIQLLPLNDTTATHTWVDSYPYAAISAFALHPMFINLEKLAGTKYATTIEGIALKQAELNALPDVDYEAVMTAKWEALRNLFGEMKKSWSKDAGYKAFYEHNKHWLLPYAIFCYLRDKYFTSDFSKWPANNVYDAKEAERMVDPHFEDYDHVAIHLFIQYHLHLQLQEAVDYAHEQGIIMKGDIPIGIYRNSCDAWVEPELYNMDAQAGAPPDDFAVKGQNWGFPTYNWQKMQDDNFKWWTRRFEQMSHYFDAFRIDHILGFFRIWSIPMQSIEGIMGSFDPCIPVYEVEFAEKGIWFDYDRYCKPYITDEVLHELFGGEAEPVKRHFLERKKSGGYQFKPDYDTQRKIDAYFHYQIDFPEWSKLRLFDLASNVIFFDDTENPDPEKAGYHFRIEMETTTSYRYLDGHTKEQLRQLYINYYYRRQDDFWRKEAMKKLPALKAGTNMLICGEDLGMVPDCVPGVMKDLGLLSLEIQRMPKDPSKKFFHPADAPYLSVVTPSTHDMSTIRGWWEEDRAATQQFYNLELGYFGDAPYFCEPFISRAIINQHVYSPAMWSIFQLQDLMGMSGTLRRENPEEERINIPANPKHYWRYRMHISLEDLQEEAAFNDEFRDLLVAAGRV